MWLLLCALGSQAIPASWIPAAPPAVEVSDSAYADAVFALAAQSFWPWEQIQTLRATEPARASTLARLLPQANAGTQKLCALLGAGCEGALAHEFLRIGVHTRDESLGVACLLAPAAPPPAWWPALVHAALRSDSPLPVRAAAASRLLEAGCWGAWPMARSMLRTGTALDEPAPWADWTRGGRYELPKRLLVAGLDLRLADAGLEPCAFEPNASWEAQTECLRLLEARIQELLRAESGARSPAAILELPTWIALVRDAATGDPQAGATLAMLSNEALPLLRAALAQGDPNLAWAARRALEERPR
jgi:hypothetical protein